MQVPRFEKIVINMGVGQATQQPSLLEGAVDDLTAITGQKPIVTKAKTVDRRLQAPRGQPIGCKVTLRGDRMWEFLDRLIAVAIPRIRDFRGLPAHSVGRPGQLHLRRQRADRSSPRSTTTRSTSPRGMDITIVTTAATTERASAARAFAPVQHADAGHARSEAVARAGAAAVSEEVEH